MNHWRNSPTCPRYNTHKKVVHFFILMLLLPKTPPLTYPNMKRFKGPKMDFTFHFTFHKHSLRSLFGSGGGGRRREEMASSITIKESFKEKYSTCKTSPGVNPASIFKRNHFKNFFDIIFFTRKSLVKKLKITFNFT